MTDMPPDEMHPLYPEHPLLVAKDKALGPSDATACSADFPLLSRAMGYAARVLDEIARGKFKAGSCDWEENEDGWWNTDCGNAFEFTDGSPIYNEFRCCPYCGKTLTETPYSDDEDSSANDLAHSQKGRERGPDNTENK